jgi:hypothetical protein
VSGGKSVPGRPHARAWRPPIRVAFGFEVLVAGDDPGNLLGLALDLIGFGSHHTPLFLAAERVMPKVSAQAPRPRGEAETRENLVPNQVPH